MAIETVWHVEVLYRSGDVAYFDGAGLSSDRDEAIEYTDTDEAAEDYQILCTTGFDASIEVSQRVARFPASNVINFLQAAE